MSRGGVFEIIEWLGRLSPKEIECMTPISETAHQITTHAAEAEPEVDTGGRHCSHSLNTTSTLDYIMLYR